MNKAYLLIGGNLGDRCQNMTMAREMISQTCGKILSASSLYETAAWGKADQPAFYNQALEINTALTANQLLAALLAAEKKMGRIRNEKLGPRLIDMDILFFNDDIIQTDTLQVPHPQLANRRFALMPLEEIAPGMQHPILHTDISGLLAACTDQLPVNKL